MTDETTTTETALASAGAGASASATETPALSDTATATVQPTQVSQAPQQAPEPTSVPVPTQVARVTDPHHAATLLKGKTSELHTLVNNIGHYATLPFTAVEAVVADISYLVNLIRSKV